MNLNLDNITNELFHRNAVEILDGGDETDELYDAQIMNDVSYGFLEAAGIKKNLWSDDSYTTETDPEMIKTVNKLRKERNK